VLHEAPPREDVWDSGGRGESPYMGRFLRRLVTNTNIISDV
jgi:hypothetical protein